MVKRERLGDRIKRLRKQRELGLRETALKLDISPSYLSLIETGQVKTPPAAKVIADIAALLEDDFDGLMLLAGRVPEDIEDKLVADPALTTFLRTASAQGFSGKDLIEMLGTKGGKP